MYDDSLVRSLVRRPDPACSPPNAPSCSAKEAAALQRVVDHFSDPDLRLPLSTSRSSASAERKGLSEWEKCYSCCRESLLRALRADRWDVGKAVHRIEHTIEWRREVGMDDCDITGHLEVVKKEGPTGKLFVLGYDKECRPILHMRPRYQNTAATSDRLSFTFWTLDRAIDIMPTGQEKLLFMIDLAAPTEGPQIKQQREFIRILSHHYNERLGRASLLHMPLVAQMAFKIIRPLIDPITYQKLSFDKDEPLRVAPSTQLDAHVGGTNGFEWDAKYWDTLIDECSRRRNERLKAFRETGGGIGWSEWTATPPGHAETDGASSKDGTAVATPEPAHSTPEATKTEPVGEGAAAATAVEQTA